MAIRPFKTIPRDIREWTNFLTQTLVTPTDATVGDSTFQDRSGVSVIGRAQNTSGTPADIVAAGNNQFLGRRANVVGFYALSEQDIPGEIARDTEVTSAIAAHSALADPHPGYLTPAEGNAAYQPLATALTNIFRGAGSPEGVVTATRGAMYQRTDGGAGTCFYIKESDTSNTGWVAK